MQYGLWWEHCALGSLSFYASCLFLYMLLSHFLYQTKIVLTATETSDFLVSTEKRYQIFQTYKHCDRFCVI